MRGTGVVAVHHSSGSAASVWPRPSAAPGGARACATPGRGWPSALQIQAFSCSGPRRKAAARLPTL